MLKTIGTSLLIVAIAIMVLSPILTIVMQQPILAVTIRTFSMVPVLNRGDMVFIVPVLDDQSLNVGQIIVYQAPEDGIKEWTMHRIVGGDAVQGYITKGDANERIDQSTLNYPNVKPEWVKGMVPAIGDVLLKIPLLGYLPLLLEENLNSPFLVPVFLGILTAVLILDEVTKSKKRRKKESFQKHHFYFIGAIAFAVMMGAVMLMGSQFINMVYGVSDSPGAFFGSEVGILEKGTSHEVALVELINHGALPSFYVAVSSDPQVELEQDVYNLSGGDQIGVKAVVHAREEGIHKGSVVIGMFLPFLPTAVIKSISQSSIWLAFTITAVVPAIPLFFMPFLDNRFRRKTVRAWRKKVSKINAILS